MSRPTHLMRLSVFAVVVSLACASGPPASRPSPREAISLTLRLEEGKTYRQRMTQEMAMSTEVMGQPMDTRSRNVTTMSFAVREVAENADMVVDVTYDAMSMSMDNPMMSFSYDSENPQAVVPEMAAGLAAMVGQTFTLRFAPDGSVVESAGLAALMERMLDETSREQGPLGEAMRESLLAMFGEEGFEKSMEMMTGHLPDEPVRVGDSWSRSVEMPMAFSLRIESTWSLTDIRDGIVHLSVASTVGDGTETVQEMGPVTMRYLLTGEQRGTMEVDASTGWTLRSRVEATFSGSMSTEIPGAGAINAPISMRSTITVEPVGGSLP